jgi:L,D-transpeptidase ErfK/SrfK
MPPGFPEARHGRGRALRGRLSSLLPGALTLAMGLTGMAASGQPQASIPPPGDPASKGPATPPGALQISTAGGTEPGAPSNAPAGIRDGLPLRPRDPSDAPQAGNNGSPADSMAPQRELVLDRRHRRLLVLEGGRPLRRFPVAVGMPGWETPVGHFRVIEMTSDPVWEHPISGLRIPPGPQNPLGSRWIGFHRDCDRQRGAQGGGLMQLRGCVAAGFHGTPNRTSIGRAVSHGCVRLYDEDVRSLFELVQLGTPVTVLP